MKKEIKFIGNYLHFYIAKRKMSEYNSIIKKYNMTESLMKATLQEIPSDKKVATKFYELLSVYIYEMLQGTHQYNLKNNTTYSVNDLVNHLKVSLHTFLHKKRKIKYDIESDTIIYSINSDKAHEFLNEFLNQVI